MKIHMQSTRRSLGSTPHPDVDLLGHQRPCEGRAQGEVAGEMGRRRGHELRMAVGAGGDGLGGHVERRVAVGDPAEGLAKGHVDFCGIAAAERLIGGGAVLHADGDVACDGGEVVDGPAVGGVPFWVGGVAVKQSLRRERER
jgi:hypothetical protein